MGQEVEATSQSHNFESSDSKIVSTMKSLNHSLLKGYHNI